MSHETAPLISIIVAVFNGVKTLQQCIDSVAMQTYPNKELIIIDGGSNDGTVDLLKTNQEQIRYWISEPDLGIYNAWNKGLTQAQGEWICFLGADDFFWDLKVLERISTQLGKLPASTHIAYGQIMLISTDGENLYSVGEPWQKIKERFKQVMCINHQGVMHRRGLFEQYGKFDESFHITGDYELLLRELKTSDAFFIPDIINVAMRQGGLSSKPANTLLTMRELRRAQRMHGLPLPGWIWLMAMARVYIRLLLWNLIGEQATRKLIDFGRRMTGRPSYWTKT
ncbi:MAG: glycosyltransferase family 2 protein [Methylococcaceae bacterium]|jgi:hypothetical protein